MTTENQPVSDGGSLPLSQVFRALSDRQRRYVLYYLRDHDQAEVDDIAIQLVAWEQDIPTNKVSTEDVQPVKSSLVHSHLPSLAEDGFIEYDSRSGAVCYSYPSNLLDKVVEFAATIENHP